LQSEFLADPASHHDISALLGRVHVAETEAAGAEVMNEEEEEEIDGRSRSAMGRSSSSGSNNSPSQQPFVRRNSIRDSWHSGSTIHGLNLAELADQ
jgi:hypothetical protein